MLGLLLAAPFLAYLAWLVWALVAYPIPLGYNLRSLWQRKLSSFSTAAAIALVVGIFVVVLSLAQGLSVAFVSSGRPDQALVLRPNARFELNSSIERDRMRILKVHPLLKRDAKGPMASAEVVVVKLFPMADGTDTNVTVRGLEGRGITLRPQVQLVQGRWFRPGLSEVVVPRKMQGRFPVMELGRNLRMGGRDWLIVGTFDAGGASYESEVWSDVNDVMQAFRRESYSAMLARLENPERVEGFGKTVDEDKRLKLEVVRETDYFKELTKAGDPIKILGNLITLILTGAAIFAAMNTMYAAVAGRTKEIGTLRALGFRQREILASFQWESIFLCLTGGILGSGLALFANGIQTGTTSFETFSDVSFAFTITPGLMAQGVAFSLVMGLLGGFLPAWRASRIPLTEAMKGG
ncbi:MAG: ABC transporter permease [Holophagaceae bacterium]|uniref:ABC transporter permease n=1 Tax=Candidatus Geothrix skivensis TaxID=2954439 RepID=A0A9D7SK34_9BACT|nr:ABC transporter permease [Candidatus Geothrix skivensis]